MTYCRADTLAVPLNGSRKATMKVKLQAVTSVPPGKRRGRKDTDTLTLRCLAP